MFNHSNLHLIVSHCDSQLIIVFCSISFQNDMPKVISIGSHLQEVEWDMGPRAGDLSSQAFFALGCKWQLLRLDGRIKLVLLDSPSRIPINLK